MSKIQALQQLTKETEEFQKRIEQRGKELLLQATQELLQNNPQVRSLYWTQYTPYFNDGEPCYFRFNDVNALIEDPEKIKAHEAEKRAHEDKQATAKALSEEQRKKLGVEIEEWIDPDLDSLCNDEYVGTYSAEKKRAKYGAVWDDIIEVATWVTADANKNTLETVFGDHVKVIVTRDGVVVEGYDHD